MRLAWFALGVAPLVLLLVALHTLVFALADPLASARHLVRRAVLSEPTLTPAGIPPRLGPGSHPAIDLRHSPFVPTASGFGARHRRLRVMAR